MDVKVEVKTPWLAVPVPRLVSGLELEVMSSCLVRLGREVEEGRRRGWAWSRRRPSPFPGPPAVTTSKDMC